MPPESRGAARRPGLLSRSTPNLSHQDSGSETNDTPPTVLPAQDDSPDYGFPSQPASVEDLSLDGPVDTTSSPPLNKPAGKEQEEDEHSDESSSDSSGTDSIAKLPNKRPLYKNHHQSRSYTSLNPQTFAPPFYNRPPTPLPPSPSLTSLLRPTFSTHNSRPGTPDHSSDEGPAGTHTPGPPNGVSTPLSTTLTSTYRAATKPIPRASPKVPTYEYYGFTLYLTSSLAFIVYILWSFLPSPFLHQLGIYYYPNRWWALAIPAWTVMFIVYIYVALASYNVGYLTLKTSNVECLVDEAANVAVVDERGSIVRGLEGPSWNAGGHGAGDVGRNGGKAKGRGRNRKKNGASSVAGGSSRASSRQPSVSGLQVNSGLAPGLDWRELWNEGTDAVMDVPLGGICEILYGGWEQDEHSIAEE